MPVIVNGWKPQKEDSHDFGLHMLLGTQPQPAAPSVDLRPLFKFNHYDQQWNDCTANAACAYSHFLTGQAYSRLFLYRETGDLEGDTSDDGRTCRDTIKTLNKQGVPLEKDWSYAHSHLIKEPTDAVKQKAQANVVTAYYSVDAGVTKARRLDAARIAMSSGHPVYCGTTLPQAALGPDAARTGLIPYPIGTPHWIGGHAIVLVGYNDAKRLLTFWNSWGSWGDGGCGYLPYEYITQGALRDCWVLQAQK